MTLGNGQVVTRAYLTGDNLPALIANAAVGNYTYGWEASPRRRPRREERGEDAVASLTDKTSETITGSMSGYGFAVPTGGYDDQNRLTAWNRTNGTKNQAWALSSVGDWNSFVDAGVTQARTHGPTHEILTIGSATVTHDSRGNMTQDEQGQQLTWNADGMLASATVPAGASTGVEGTHTYQYDALGRRVRKTTGGAGASDTVFVRDGQTVVAEYAATSAAASPLRKYVNASYVDEPVLLIDRTAAGSVGAGTDERFYYHRNQQYSITALCDNSGAVVERYAYTAYGEPTILDGAGTTTRTASFIGNPYLYTTQEYDAETGLYHFNARMYEGRKGRFLSRDPSLYHDGDNAYQSWMLLSQMDPSGKFAIVGETVVVGALCVVIIVWTFHLIRNRSGLPTLTRRPTRTIRCSQGRQPGSPCPDGKPSGPTWLEIGVGIGIGIGIGGGGPPQRPEPEPTCNCCRLEGGGGGFHNLLHGCAMSSVSACIAMPCHGCFPGKLSGSMIATDGMHGQGIEFPWHPVDCQ